MHHDRIDPPEDAWAGDVAATVLSNSCRTAESQAV